MTERIGSRKAPTIFYKSAEQTECQVSCDCFRGTLPEFEKRVAAEHGDNEHGKRYAQEIAIAKMVFGVLYETPTALDMFEALEKVLEVMAEDMPVGLRKVCYDALAKARGEV